MLRLLPLLLTGALALSACSEKEDAEPLGPTPRELLFDISLPTHVRLSPAGRWVSFAQNYQGTSNLWLKPADGTSQPRPITRFDYPGAGPHVWHPSGQYILFLRQTPEVDDVRPYVFDLETQETRSLLGNLAQQARFLALSDADEDHVYLMSNARNGGRNDIFKVDLQTGAGLLVHQDDLGASGYFAGPDLEPLIAQIPAQRGGFEWRMQTPDGAWRLWGTVAPEDALTTRIEQISRDGMSVYVASSIGRNTTALVKTDASKRFDPAAATLLAAQDEYDFVDATYHPLTVKPIVAEFATPRPSWVPLDTALTGQIFGMRASGSGQLRIEDSASSDERWLIAHENASQPPKWGVFNAGRAEKIVLFPQQDALMAQQAAIQTRPVRMETQNGTLDGFLTIPLGLIFNSETGLEAPVPTVIELRGALASRDRWAYRPVHQWLASRGVAVLSFNHRGSSGQGKAHLGLGAGASLVEDLADAASWLRAKNITDTRLAIVASGFGARIALEWASLPGSAPKCIAAGNPALDVSEALSSLPEELAGLKSLLKNLPSANLQIAPLPRQPIPLMLAHGAQNRRQAFDAVENWADDANQKGHAVTLVSVNRAEELFDRNSDARGVMAIMEAFLAPCLGFEAEPLTIEDFKNADVSLVMAPPALNRSVTQAQAMPGIAR